MEGCVEDIYGGVCGEVCMEGHVWRGGVCGVKGHMWRGMYGGACVEGGGMCCCFLCVGEYVKRRGVCRRVCCKGIYVEGYICSGMYGGIHVYINMPWRLDSGSQG